MSSRTFRAALLAAFILTTAAAYAQVNLSTPARTNRLLVRLLTDDDQERSTSNAHGKVVAASLRATPLPFGGVGSASDQEDIS